MQKLVVALEHFNEWIYVFGFVVVVVVVIAHNIYTTQITQFVIRKLKYN